MARKESDINGKWFLSKFGSIYEGRGNEYFDVDNKWEKAKKSLPENYILSLSEFNYYVKINKHERNSLYTKGIYQKLQDAKIDKHYKIKMNNESVKVKIIGKGHSRNGEFLIKFVTEDKKEHCEPESIITDIVEIGEEGSKVTSQDQWRNNNKNIANEEKSIEDGFYIVADKLSSACDSGSIIRVTNGVVINRDDFKKQLHINDLERDKLDKIEENESKYLLKYKINERLEKHKNKIFNKIKELKIGEECRYKNDSDRIYIVKQKNIADKGVQFVLQMKNLLNKREINADLFDIELIENSRKEEFHIITDAKHPHKEGTIFYNENGITKTFPDNVIINIQHDEGKLRKIDKVEANFLKMFSPNERKKILSKEKFKKINELKKGDKCFVDGNEFIVDNKYVSSDQLKFDLSPQKSSSVILTAVDANEIHFKKKRENISNKTEKNTQQNLQSIDRNLIIRQSSTGSGTSNDSKGTIKSQKIADFHEIKCGSVKLKVFNPQTSFVVDEGHSNISKTYIAIRNDNNQIFAKLLWKGMINHQICIGCEMSSNVDNGTDGTFDGKELFKCERKKGVLIALNGNIITCENENCGGHSPLNDKEIIKEDDICCLKEIDSFPYSNIKIGDVILFNKNKPFSGTCKWIGLINGKECVAVVSIEHNPGNLYKSSELAQCIKTPSSEMRKVVMFQIQDIPSIVNCDQINLDVVNPYSIGNIDNKNAKSFDKFIIVKNKQKSVVVKLLWKGKIDENICLGCEILSDWSHGTNGSFKEMKLFECKDKRGVLIVISDEVETCESEDHREHKIIKENQIIKEDDICCLKFADKLSSTEIIKKSNLIWTVDNKLRGSCEWMGLINGKECVGISQNDSWKSSRGSGNYQLLEKLNIHKNLVFVSLTNIIVEKLYFVEDKIVDLEQVFTVESKTGQYSFGINVGNPVILNMCGNQERKSMIGEVKWIGKINNEKCVGLDMEKECVYGMDGIIDKDNRFVCEHGHGLVTTLENVELYLYKNKLKTLENGLVDPNQYIKSDEKYSFSAKQFKMNENVFVKLLDGDIWLKGAIRWFGEMNDEQVAVVELEENHENGTNGKFWRQQLFTCQRNRAVATRCNNINKCIPLKYNNGIFVEKTKLIQASNIIKNNDKYKVGELIQFNMRPIIYGEVSFFSSYYDQDLVGIIMDMESINKLASNFRDILWQTPYFDVGSTGIIAKIESIGKCKKELKFIKESCIIDTQSVVCKIINQSDKFCMKDIVKLNNGGKDIFYIIIDFCKLNGEPCVEVVESILSNGEKIYLHEIDTRKINESDWEMKYFQQTIIDPSSIITLQECANSDFEIGNKIKFNLKETYELFEGVIKFIGKANNILCGAVQLIDDKINDKNENLRKYRINGNETFNCIWEHSNLSIILLLPLNVLKLQENYERVRGIPVVDPKFVKRIEGKKIDRDREIIFSCEGTKCCATLKWKGKVNNKYCLGCEIDYRCQFGTDGKFGDKILFRCEEKRGILIPTDSIDRCCEIVGHENIVEYNSKIINSDNICCIRTDQNVGKEARIYLNEQIKRKDANEYPICKWLGYVNKVKCVGVDLSYHVNEGTNGTFCGIKLFQCQNNYGALYRLSEFISKKSGLKNLPDIGLYIMDSFNVKSIENGKQIEKLMTWKCNERTYLLKIKWRGCVDGELCIGCELMNDTPFGTDGTFAGKKIFNCVKGRGVLIPVYTINDSCEDGKHSPIKKYSDGILTFAKNYFYSINPDCICCIEPVKLAKDYPSIQIGSRINYVKGNQLFDGVCEWVGLVNGKETIGAKLKESNSSGTNGQFNNFKLFNCEPKKGFLFLIEDVKHDFKKEKLYFIRDKVVDTNKIYFASSLDKQHEYAHFIEHLAITVLTFHGGNKQELIGVIKWIGKINNQKCVGLDMEDKFDFGINGEIYDNHKFDCLKGHGMITLLDNIELLENIDASHFCKNGIINPDKYLVCREKRNNEFLNSRNVKLNEFVFVLLKDSNGERKKKGTLRWCGTMNELSVCIVELDEEHESGTDGRFWRNQLIKCGKKRAIAVLSSNIDHYEPFESLPIPDCDRIFPDIDINSAVKYYHECDNEYKDLYGTVRWSGKDENGGYLYGIELDDRLNGGTDGQFNGQRLFNCQNGHGILAAIDSVGKDSRFVDLDVTPENITLSEECKVKQSSFLTQLSEGSNKGIQGNANSCYFDSAIFALFVKSDVLDFMIDDINNEINNEIETNDITKQFRRILAFKIIYPLRKFGFVSFHRTNEMRDVIVEYGSKFKEMTKQESDMENVAALLSKLCPDEQLLSIRSHNGNMTKCMFIQLFLTLGKKVKVMTSEEMLKISMLQNDIMFNELPTCLIMQAPRDARGINCYEFVLPSNSIEISQVCSNYFKKCFHCEDEAVYQCKECIEDKLDISSCFLCKPHKCVHNSIMKINISNKSTSKVYLELKAIICIEKCHFVSYVKQSAITNQNIDNQWYFFDSMSSQSISNNYAIPKVTYSKNVTDLLNLNIEDMKEFIQCYGYEDIKRIVKDSYIFVYQNSAKTCY